MSNISYQVTGVITKVGISAAIQAGSTGPQINVAGFRIGSLSAAEGSVALDTDIDVDGLVYSGDTTAMTYSQIDDDTLIWRIRLDPSIGNFDVGNIGIVLDGGVLFCKAVLPGQSAKYKSNPPAVVGNTRFYNIVMHMANAAGLINLTVLEANQASLPEVATENDLPAPNSTPFNAYLVRNHTHIGEPVTAVRTNGVWLFAPHHLFPNQGIGIIACQTTMFDASAVLTRAVYLDSTSGTFKLADGSVLSKQSLGVRTSPYEITMDGMVPASVVGLATPLTPGTIYYVDVGSNAGKLTTIVNGNPVAFAASTQDVYLSCATGFGSNINYTQENIGMQIGNDAIQPGLVPGSVVYLDTSAGRVWKAADPSQVHDYNDYTAHRPTGVLDLTMTRVVFFGTLNIPSTTAWPLPFNVGSLYFADVGANAGRLTASGPASRWIIGTAVDQTRLLINMLALASDSDHTEANPTHNKAATPGGVAQMISAALADLPPPPAIPGAYAPITFDGSNYGCLTASYTVQGSGRSATLDEVMNGQSATTFLYPWVTPETLAQWKPKVCSDGVTIAGDGTPHNPLRTIVAGTTTGGSITIMPATMPVGQVAISYSFQMTASGGVAPYVWSVTAGQLPAGLTLNSSTGLVSGTPLPAPATGGTPIIITTEFFFGHFRRVVPALRCHVHIPGHGFYIGQEITIANSSATITVNGYTITSPCFNRGWVVERILDSDRFTFVLTDFTLFGFHFGFNTPLAFAAWLFGLPIHIGPSFLTVSFVTVGLHTGNVGGSTGDVTIQAHDAGSLVGTRKYDWKIIPSTPTVHVCHWHHDYHHGDRRHCGWVDHLFDITFFPIGFRGVGFGDCELKFLRGFRILSIAMSITGEFWVCIKGNGGVPPIRSLFHRCQYTAFDASLVSLTINDDGFVYSVSGDIAYWKWPANLVVYLPESGSGNVLFT